MTDITAHMVVRNEDRFVWYAISSVLPYVDKFIIFDTGSTDKTSSIIETFKDKKIVFSQKNSVDTKGLVNVRQSQIDMTETSWIWIVDGDEVYPSKTAEKISQLVESKKDYLGIIVHRYDLLGDVYHYQNEKVGEYNQFGRKGHYVLRLINKKKISGLKVCGDYPYEYFADKDGNSIKEKGKKYFPFVEERIFHGLYLKRSSRGASLPNVLNRNKYKIELGTKIETEELPEVFFWETPFVSDLCQRRNWLYILVALAVTPIKFLKRKMTEYIQIVSR